MVKFIRCVCNKLTVSSDVGFEMIRRSCRSLATEKYIADALFLSGS